MSSILKTFLLAALAYFIIPAVASADPCIKAVTNAEKQCKAFVTASAQDSAKKVQAMAKTMRENGERGPAATQRIKAEFATISGAGFTVAAAQCRGLIPECARSCETQAPCKSMIEGLTYQIEAAVKKGVRSR
jgi:hypothetical protein